MRRGASGVTYLNKQLQAMVNPPAPHGARPKPELAIPPQSAGKLLRVGDRVMQVGWCPLTSTPHEGDKEAHAACNLHDHEDR